MESNGSCELYEANSKKLETDSSGVTVNALHHKRRENQSEFSLEEAVGNSARNHMTEQRG